MEPKNIIVIIIGLLSMVVITWIINKVFSKKIQKNKEIFRKQMEEEKEKKEKLKLENPEKFKKQLEEEKENIRLEKNKKKVSIILSVIGVLIIGGLGLPPISYLVLGLVVYLIRKM